VSERADTPKRPPRLLIVGAALLGLAVLVGLVIFADAHALLETARGIPPSGLVGPLVFSFLSYAAMARSSGFALIAASVVLALFAGVLIYALVLVSQRRLRRLTLFWIGKLAHRLLRRFAPGRTPDLVRFWRFQHKLDQGVEFLLSRKRGMIGPTAWITFDWVLTSGILWAAFHSVSHPLPLGLVMVGFGVGLFISLVSFVPGGLGIMEGSMTAVFVSLGVPLHQAVVAVLIFRLTYHVIPLMVSVFLFHGVFRAARQSIALPRG
jgi:uncharacterized protein (TIRG00374 family)